MNITVKEVKTRSELRAFVNFPYRLYKKHACYIPPLRFDEVATLRPDKNPAFDYCEARYWLAYKDGKVAGRIAGILNKAYIDKWHKKHLRFGWIDFEEDKKVAMILVEQVENWARSLGMEAVHGPMGFTDLDREGMLTEGFDQQGTLAALYNYPYYPAFLEKMGYEKHIDWIEYRIRIPGVMDAKLEKIAAVVQKRLQLNIVKLRTAKDVLPYTDALFDLINAEYSSLFGVVPLTPKQIRYYVKQYFSFIRTDFISLVTDKKGKLVAFGITMPSLSRALKKSKGSLFPFGFMHLLKALRKNDTADLLLVAVRKDLQGKGVNSLLICETLRSYIKNGVRFVETNHQLEDNKKVQAMWRFFDATPHKKRRCYIKYLQS